MPVAGITGIIVGVALATLLFSSLTYSLRNLIRSRLTSYLERHHKPEWVDRTADNLEDLILITATWRMIANVVLALAVFALVIKLGATGWLAYLLAAVLGTLITMIFSVALPHTLAEIASAEIVGFFVRPLYGLRMIMGPVMGPMRGIDNLIRSAAGVREVPEAEEIEQEIMSAVEEGQKEGVVNEQEREMIESVIESRETTVGQIMTPRPQVVAIELEASLDQIRKVIEQSGHSRIPVFTGTLDQIVGILYTRDLVRLHGNTEPTSLIKSIMRPPFYVPETKPLRDLLRDFRLQKIHIAIVLDEYGGTAGLVTIEDLVEELVGVSGDERAGAPAQFKRVSDGIVEADAQIDIDEINRLTGLSLPDDAGYSTLGGFISTMLGRIPETGTVMEHNGAKFTVLDAEPQRIKRVKIEQAMQPASEAADVRA